ncbi:MAG: hypothetical protein WCF03_21570 [Nitrososphaeraceae archaeon]
MAADNPWQKLIEEQEFQDAIHKNGYYQSNLSFQPFVRKYQLTLKNRAPAYLSIDFWSGQSHVLTKNKLYVIRIGKGRVELQKNGTTIDLHFTIPENYELVGLNIVPIYYLRQRNFVYLFIFPKMDFYNDGILLNDVTKFTPTKIFRINVASLTDNV